MGNTRGRRMPQDCKCLIIVGILVCSLSVIVPKADSFVLDRCNGFRPIKRTLLPYSVIDEVTSMFTVPYVHDVPFHVPTYEQAGHLLSQAAGSIQMYEDPSMVKVEGEFLSDVSRIVLDLSIFMIDSENTALLRLISIVGRLIGMLSDYLTDYTIRPDEGFFQVLMITIYLFLWTQSILPDLQRLLYEPGSSLPDRRDVIAFRSIFESSGLTWVQFKSLRASKVVDWVEIAPGDTNRFKSEMTGEYNDDDIAVGHLKNVHWIYDSISKSFDASFDIGEVASSQLFRKLAKRKHLFKNTPTKQDDVTHSKFTQDLSKYDEVVAQGATLLRINTERMVKMMDNNENLSVSMLFLAVECLQRQAEDKNSTSSGQSNFESFQTHQPVPFSTSMYLEDIKVKNSSHYMEVSQFKHRGE